MSVRLVPGLGRNLLSSSTAPANRVETIPSAFLALRGRGGNFPLRADDNLYFLDVFLLELPSEYAHVGETSSVMSWHRSLRHVNVLSVNKLAEDKGSGKVVKDTGFSVSHCDTCGLAKSKQLSHPTMARIDVTQLLQLVHTDLSGPFSPTSGAGNSCVARFTDHHTRLKSVYFLRKKKKAIDALMDYTEDEVIPSGYRLYRLRFNRGGEYTGTGDREYCLQTGTRQEFAATKTQPQNGISEREGASLWNMTKCFRAEAGVSKYLW